MEVRYKCREETQVFFEIVNYIVDFLSCFLTEASPVKLQRDLTMDQRIRKVQLLFIPLLLVCAMFLAAVGNHTGRIKVVFTPTICKLTCIGGRCHNNCKVGNTTTIISENGHATDTLTAPNFRVGK